MPQENLLPNASFEFDFGDLMSPALKNRKKILPISILIGITLSMAQAQTVTPALPLVEMDLRQVFAKPTFNQPVFLTHAGDGSDRVFIVEKEGIIKVMPNQDEVIEATVFLDISEQTNSAGGEAGLLGLAFHPRFSDNGQFYVYYTRDDFVSRLAEFQVNADTPDRAEIASERVVLEIDQPSVGHNGGSIAFGPDGYLYWGLGDGSGGSDVFRSGQDLLNLLAAILRIDVDNNTDGLAYGIPADNPLVGNENGWRQEIWAWGLRNPWRFSFDRLTGTLWAGDVGQSNREEVDIIEKGRNYGWSITEGTACFFPAEGCATEGLTPPLVEYGRDLGTSVIGGYVYRGSRLRRLQGVYLYGDFGTRRIWGLRYADGQIQDHIQLAVDPSNLTSFGEDEAGEVYLLNFSGEIYVLDEKPGNAPDTSIEAYTTSTAVPHVFRLKQNYPNPFNSSTILQYEISDAAAIGLEIYDITGQKMQEFNRNHTLPGVYEVSWDGFDMQGKAVSTGVYFSRLKSGDFSSVGKMLMIK
jgi:glucose/arabinose dehydrogenase